MSRAKIKTRDLSPKSDYKNFNGLGQLAHTYSIIKLGLSTVKHVNLLEYMFITRQIDDQ